MSLKFQNALSLPVHNNYKVSSAKTVPKVVFFPHSFAVFDSLKLGFVITNSSSTCGVCLCVSE